MVSTEPKVANMEADLILNRIEVHETAEMNNFFKYNNKTIILIRL